MSSGGFRLELSEKNKRLINDFEKRLTQNLFKKNSYYVTAKSGN